MNGKVCIGCHEFLLFTQFYPKPSMLGGVGSRCKNCTKICNREHYYRVRENPEYRSRVRDYGKIWHLKNRAQRNPLTSARDRDLRLRCINHYGGRCACCGESRFEFLSIDHINGGGNQHRKLIGNKVWRWLIKNDFPQGFRVLCHNCNQSLGYNKYCPHQREAQAV